MGRLFGRDPAPVAATAFGLLLILLATAALVPFRTGVTRATPALVLVLAVALVGLVGGRVPALVTALAAAAAFNLAFIPPYWKPDIGVVDDWVALGTFVAIALAVGTLVAGEAARRRTAEVRASELLALHERLQSVQEERERLAEESTRLVILEQVDEQRAALLRSVSHDLRTPLSTIRAVVSDLRTGDHYATETRDDLLDLVLDETERLDRIVANLMSMSRIEAGALQPRRQAVAVDEMVAETVRRMTRVLRNVRLEVSVPADLPLVDVDYSQVDQVLTNLLENAARHAPARSTVRVHAQARDDHMVAITVQDEGPGVLPFDHERIFQPFWRGSGSATSGVGLSICKAIVEAHGGTIRVESWGKGAKFVLTLPVRDG